MPKFAVLGITHNRNQDEVFNQICLLRTLSKVHIGCKFIKYKHAHYQMEQVHVHTCVRYIHLHVHVLVNFVNVYTSCIIRTCRNLEVCELHNFY